MTYLFWAFAIVWGGIFLYLYALIRRSQALAREVEALRDEAQKPAPPAAAPADRSRAGRA
jgi:CcmD family protein